MTLLPTFHRMRQEKARHNTRTTINQKVLKDCYLDVARICGWFPCCVVECSTLACTIFCGKNSQHRPKSMDKGENKKSLSRVAASGSDHNICATNTADDNQNSFVLINCFCGNTKSNKVAPFPDSDISG